MNLKGKVLYKLNVDHLTSQYIFLSDISIWNIQNDYYIVFYKSEENIRDIVIREIEVA